MACPSGSNSSSHGSSLEQLIEEINFQRAKEMRQLLKDDSGFVMLHGTAYWTDLFVRHFLMEDDRTAQESDDLLFFIRKQHLKEAKKSVPKFETLLEVQRRDSKKLPIGDPEIDWEETIYANLIIHRFDYYVTLAVCTRTSPKELQVLSRHTERVWASPSRRLMSDKGTSEDITYPNICFMLDNFDEAFTEIVVRDGEMVSVELVARDRTAFLQSVIFLGSVRYDALRRVYDARTSLTTRMAQRMTFGLYSGADAQRMEFVRVRGPMGKGHAELAVTKPAGCGSPTSSEPGGTLAEQTAAAAAGSTLGSTLGSQHEQRRASDPSGNFNCLTKTNLRRKSPDGSKTFTSENNVPTLVEDSVSEADDGGPPDGVGCVKCSSAEEATVRDIRGQEDAAAGEWTAAAAEEAGGDSSRAPVDESDSTVRHMTPSLESVDAPVTEGGAEAEATPAVASTGDAVSELAMDAVAYHRPETDGTIVRQAPAAEGGDEPAAGSPAQQHGTADRPGAQGPDGDGGRRAGEDADGRTPAPELSPETRPVTTVSSAAGGTDTTQPAGLRRASCSDAGRSRSGQRPPVVTPGMLYRRAYGQTGAAAARCACARTPDGTVVHYRCHVQQAFLRQRELDDGVCNPIWSMRGLSQSLHFWRETKRTSSLPLNTYLTYVMLPWHTIISDLIAKENRQDPILSF